VPRGTILNYHSLYMYAVFCRSSILWIICRFSCLCITFSPRATLHGYFCLMICFVEQQYSVMFISVISTPFLAIITSLTREMT